MKTLIDFFKTDLSLMNTVIGLCFAFIASLPLCAIAENEHPTGEQWFSAYFLAGIMLAAAVFFFGFAIKEFNDSQFPNFHRSGSITGMRRIYGIDAKLVRCGNYIYNVTSEPQIYDAAH